MDDLILHRTCPYYRWVRFLLAYEGLGTEDVHDLVQLSGFPGVDTELVDMERDILREDGALDGDLADPDFSEWFCQERLDLFLVQDKFWKETQDILANNDARRLVENMSCVRAGCSAADIADIVNEATGLNFSPGGITRYLQTYWDISQITLDGWHEYSLLHDDLKRQKVEWHLRLDLHNINDLAYAVWRSGYHVDVDRVEALEKMRTEAYMRFMSTKGLGNGQSASIAAKNWGDIFTSMDGKLQEQEGQKLVSTLVDRITKLGLKYDKKELISKDDLG